MATKRTNKPTQALYLHIMEERSPGWGDGPYFHIRLRVCTQKYENGQYVVYGVDDDYDNGILYSNLRISCQGDEKSRLREHIGHNGAVYGWDVLYHDVYTVDARKATRMSKTLALIERKLRQLADRRGYAGNFGDYCGRVAEALGCVGMVETRGEKGRVNVGDKFRWHANIGDGINAINNAIWRWQQEAKEKGQEAAS
jgi:hypothetical protein